MPRARPEKNLCTLSTVDSLPCAPESPVLLRPTLPFPGLQTQSGVCTPDLPSLVGSRPPSKAERTRSAERSPNPTEESGQSRQRRGSEPAGGADGPAVTCAARGLRQPAAPEEQHDEPRHAARGRPARPHPEPPRAVPPGPRAHAAPTLSGARRRLPGPRARPGPAPAALGQSHQRVLGVGSAGRGAGGSAHLRGGPAGRQEERAEPDADPQAWRVWPPLFGKWRRRGP